jgi:NAD(P)H dehydrogenase (quinone)
MNPTDKTIKIAISGASGQLGRQVVELVAGQAGPEQVVALTRTPDKLADLARRGVQVVAGDFARPEELAQSLNGVDRFLLISTDDLQPGVRVSRQRAAVEAARQAGVGRLVYTSAIDPLDSPVTFLRDHAETEQAIVESGLSYTFLRNNLYADVVVGVAPQAIATGELRLPVGEGAVGFVARDDCARIAAAVLTTTGHERQIYDVTGPGALTYHDVARELAAVSGKPVRYVPLSAAAFRQEMAAAGLPAGVVELLLTMYGGIAANKFNVVSSAMQELTGTAPLSLAETLARKGAALFAPATAAH